MLEKYMGYIKKMHVEFHTHIIWINADYLAMLPKYELHIY